MFSKPTTFPPIPKIGQAESYYGILIREADSQGNQYAHEAAKVGQYVTLALDPHLDWAGKLRYFQHALRRHCQPPSSSGGAVVLFYKSLADLVRQYAGLEALKLASNRDDAWAMRIGIGAKRWTLALEARQFFTILMGNGEKRPEWFGEEDWKQLRIIRAQWVGES